MRLNFTRLEDSWVHGYGVRVGRYRVEYVRAYQGEWGVFVVDTITNEHITPTQADAMLGEAYASYMAATGFLPYSTAVRIAHQVARQLFHYQSNDKALWEGTGEGLG